MILNERSFVAVNGLRRYSRSARGHSRRFGLSAFGGIADMNSSDKVAMGHVQTLLLR
jgi:hypothetical protein